MKILHIPNTCTGCGACVSSCAKGALNLDYNEEGFYYPHLDTSKCVDCKACENVCHVLITSVSNKENRDYTPFMLKSNDEKLVKRSSSGGIFSLLAIQVLKNGGIVYGARYSYETERLEHCSTDKCSLDELRKSKYIESYLGDTFSDVKKQLKNRREVLFCGTPCQVKGLKTYLDRCKINQDSLLLVRFICHGVPANKFFTEYKHFEEKKWGSKVVHLDFRPKNHGWTTSNLVMKFENGKILDEHYTCNYYYYYFQHNYLLRSSCYTCNQMYDVVGDFTIADFWGVHKYDESLNDEKGLSLVFAQTEKAREYLEVLSETMFIKELPQSAVNYIYSDRHYRLNCQKERASMIDDVLKHGYMPAVLKNVRKEVLKNRLRHKFFNSQLWKLIKKIK